MSLFRNGPFILHSGDQADWKIDCDALTNADWKTLAAVIAKRIGPFRGVCGIPEGGMPLAEALAPMSTGDWHDPFLIVDDVYTTGASMREVHNWVEATEAKGTENIIGVVVFARRPVKEDWITALFTVTMEETQ